MSVLWVWGGKLELLVFVCMGMRTCACMLAVSWCPSQLLDPSVELELRKIKKQMYRMQAGWQVTGVFYSCLFQKLNCVSMNQPLKQRLLEALFELEDTQENSLIIIFQISRNRSRLWANSILLLLVFEVLYSTIERLLQLYSLLFKTHDPNYMKGKNSTWIPKLIYIELHLLIPSSFLRLTSITNVIYMYAGNKIFHL